MLSLYVWVEGHWLEQEQPIRSHISEENRLPFSFHFIKEYMKLRGKVMGGMNGTEVREWGGLMNGHYNLYEIFKE